MFAAFHAVYVRRLFFDSQVFVNDTDAAFPCHRDCHLGFGNGIHARAQKRNVEFKPFCKFHRQIDVFGKHVAALGDKQNVVKS